MSRAWRRTGGGAGALLALLLLAACGAGEEQAAAERAAVEAHRRSVESWHAKWVESLKRPEGWLTLVGLHWLKEGTSSLGSDPMSDVVLPAEAPGRVGRLVLEDGTLELEVAAGVEATVDGEPVRRTELVPDADGEPTEVALDSLRFFAIRRGDWVGLRVRDLDSPALRAFDGIETFPVDPAWRLTARFDPYDPPRRVPVDDVTGNVQEMEAPGALVFDNGGEEHRLDAFDAGDELFVIFSDATSGKETYGAGRYLYTDRPGEDGLVEVDFNKAYNPPCAFTPYATCPLPPPQNRLDLRVEAGEKVYRGEGAH